MKRELNTWATVNRVLWSVIALGDAIAGIVLSSTLGLKIYILYGIAAAAIVIVLGFTLAAFLDTAAENANRLANIERNMQQQPKQEQKKTYTTISAAPRQSSPGFIVCPRCGESQSADRTVCFNCGTLFKKD